MSSLSGIGGMGGDPLQFLREVRGQDPAARPQGAPQVPPPGGEPPPSLWEDIEKSAETAGLSAEGVESLRTDLKEAIAVALQAVDRSAGPEAGRETIDTAILSTLEEYGIDTEELQTRMAESRNRIQNMPPPGQPPHGGVPPNHDGAPSSLAVSASGDDAASALLSTVFPLLDETA